MRDSVRVRAAKWLAPEMYAAAVEAGQAQLAATIKETTLDCVNEELMRELYLVGVTEERIHELVTLAGERAQIHHDSWLLALCQLTGVDPREVDDVDLAG